MRICLVARARLELVTFRSQSRRFPSTPHMSTFLYPFFRISIHARLSKKSWMLDVGHTVMSSRQFLHISLSTHWLHIGHLIQGCCCQSIDLFLLCDGKFSLVAFATLLLQRLLCLLQIGSWSGK